MNPEKSSTHLPAHLYGNEWSLKDGPRLSGPHILHLDSITSGPTDRNEFLIGNWLKNNFLWLHLASKLCSCALLSNHPAGINWAKVTEQIGGWSESLLISLAGGSVWGTWMGAVRTVHGVHKAIIEVEAGSYLNEFVLSWARLHLRKVSPSCFISNSTSKKKNRILFQT